MEDCKERFNRWAATLSQEEIVLSSSSSTRLPTIPFIKPAGKVGDEVNARLPKRKPSLCADDDEEDNSASHIYWGGMAELF